MVKLGQIDFKISTCPASKSTHQGDRTSRTFRTNRTFVPWNYMYKFFCTHFQHRTMLLTSLIV